MTDQTKNTPVETTEDRRDGRRRFLKVAAAGAVAVPVIESLTGAELLTTAARAQTGEAVALDGPMTGTINEFP